MGVLPRAVKAYEEREFGGSEGENGGWKHVWKGAQERGVVRCVMLRLRTATAIQKS